MNDAAALKHRRHSLRLPRYDYSLGGAYFITLCAQGRSCLFGEIRDGKMQLSPAGQVVYTAWQAIPAGSAGIVTGPFVVMPNHLHGIIEITHTPVGAIHELPLHELPLHDTAMSRTERRRMLLPKIIGRFKMQIAKAINECRETPGRPVWQRNYYEHVIRNDADYRRIAEYIADNPRRWAEDSLHPDHWAKRETEGGGNA